MYGFIEKWLADILQIPYDEFGLNDGSIAALLDKPIFDKVLSALLILWREDGDAELFKPQEIRSDIQGARVLFHRYWANDGIINGLISGETKAGANMVAFAALGVNKFIRDGFEERVRNAYRLVLEGNQNEQEGQAVRIDRAVGEGNIDLNINGNTVTFAGIRNESPSEAAEITEVAYEAPSIIPEELKSDAIPIEPSEEEKFISFFREKYAVHLRGSDSRSTKEKRKTVIIIGRGYRPPDCEQILSLADSIDKNIFVFCDKISMTEFTAIKRNFKFADIAKHTLILFLNPHETSRLVMPRVSERKESKNICFGEEISRLHFLEATDIEKSIQRDDSLTELEANDRLRSLERNPNLSIYAKYDFIYKDTSTNIVWALKDRCFIFFTFYYYDTNITVFQKCIKELSRRFDKKISSEELRKIDKEYYDSISEKNKKEYISFSISSSNSLIESLNQQFKEEKDKYIESMNKAMEHGKLMNRLAEHIESFNKEEYEARQKDKALSEYEETMKIPGVLSINIKDNIVNVYTKNLYAKDERSEKWHDIGTFHIQIGMLSNDYNQDNTVQIINTKHQIHGLSDNMQAPHVFPEGRICHGSLATGMIEAYKRRDLYQLVYQIILFLQDANTDDAAGKYINRWPEVPEEVALGQLSLNEGEYNEPTEAELKFDAILAEAIPVHT